jgi:hypothetical protein
MFCDGPTIARDGTIIKAISVGALISRPLNTFGFAARCACLATAC